MFDWRERWFVVLEFRSSLCVGTLQDTKAGDSCSIQHLRQWLQVKRMLPHSDICYLGPESGCCWYRRWVSVSSFDRGPPFASYS